MKIALKILVAGILGGMLALPAGAGSLENQLFSAIDSGAPWRVKELIRDGADLSARDGTGALPLNVAYEYWAYCFGDQACEAAYNEIIAALEAAGAKYDPDWKGTLR